MKTYNIFYKNRKINSKPLKPDDLDKITKFAKNGVINYFINNEITQIPLKDIRIIKNILV
jgi:hypothetical protein